MSAAAEGQPDWDLTPYFPEFDGPDYRRFRDALSRDLAALADRATAVGALDEGSAPGWAQLLVDVEDALSRQGHLAGYLGCLGAADARDEAVQAETSALALLRAESGKLFVRIRAVLGAAPEGAFEALVADERLVPIAWFLRRLRERASWAMEPALEELAADLDVTGLSAWGRLYDQLSGKLEFELEPPGQPSQRTPVSMTRSLLESPDRAVRRAALEGSNRAWAGAADTVASCLNQISGTRLLLYRRRGVPHFLDPALFDSAISRRTLDTMLGVVRERFELPRRYLRRKAAILGVAKLGFHDLMAPLPLDDPGTLPYTDARERVLGAFGAFHDDLRAFARGAFDRHWIDWAPRVGKRPGGFCSSSTWIGESRIFITYQGTLGDLSTLAHELGHAYHSHVMRDMRPLARRYPMTLAETASTFAEGLLLDAVLADPVTPDVERATLLDARMGDAAAYLLNIPMRFEFEKAVYDERARGELSPRRLCALMEQAQRDCYGDTLDPDALDPWFWASKLHFYITGLSFYNFPYTFGYLFSLGISARAREEGRAFLPRYVDLLRRTGSDSAERVARASLGVDLESAGFWHASLDLVEEELDRFEQVADRLWPRA